MDFFQQMTRVFEAPVPTVNRRGFRQTAGDMVVSFLEVQVKRSQLINLLVCRADDILWKGIR
jgi:hypothetical protein